MGRFRLANIEKLLMKHIAHGGSTRDQVGREIIGRFVLEALKDTEIKAVSNSWGIDANELCLMYAAMVDVLLPQPCINSGGPMLAASLPFIEKQRITTMMSQVGKMAEGLSPEMRREKLIDFAEGNAKLIWQVHTDARGEPFFTITPGSGIQKTSGCMSSVLLVLAGATWFLLAI